jgi:hypothetical protein
MRAPVVEVTDILGQDLLQMVLVENQQVIQALGPNRPHPSFRDGVGARRSERRANLCNAEIPHPPIEACAVDSVTVMNEEGRRPSIPSAAFHNLLCRPCGSRGRRYVDMDNLPVRMMDHEEDVECPKEDRLHAEEIACPDGGGVLFQEWPPARRWASMRGPMHVLGNCSSRNFVPKPGKLRLDPALTPKLVVDGHVPDQSP